MSLSRRSFVGTLGVLGASVLASRRSALGAVPGYAEGPAVAAPRPIPLHNNENPLGPGKAVLDAVRTALGEGAPAGRYPFARVDALQKAIADKFGIAPENVLTGCGSTEILRTAVQVFTSGSRPLVGGIPTYEECTGYAEMIGTPVRAVPLDAAMRLDLDKMAEKAPGAGMVFLNNPNNPTATVLPADAISAFIDRVQKTSPETTILIDEAYHDYVTDPSHKTQIPAAVKSRRVVVARTFSKAHGMAGMRIGYAIGHPDTIKALARWQGNNALNVAGIVAAGVSIKDQARLEQESVRNTEARKYTIDWFAQAGCKSTDSQCNFIFVNVGRPAKEFREACKEQGVLVARDFPPFEKTHVRVSIATLDEMKKATAVFAKVLAAKAKAAA
jgi:histidinol-phosphate aminotransferase